MQIKEQCFLWENKEERYRQNQSRFQISPLNSPNETKTNQSDRGQLFYLNCL